MSDKNKIRELTKKEEIYISQLLKNMGIPMHLLGYEYIKTCIVLIRSDKEYMRSITKMLYPEVAKKYETTGSRVERAIRHAIEVSCSRGKYELLDEVLGYNINCKKGKPSNSEFLAIITDYFRLHYNLED